MRRLFALPAVLAASLLATPAAAQWVTPAQPSPTRGFLPPGLSQPPPRDPAAIETARQLDLAKTQDAGRRLEWVWIDVSGGFEHLGLTTFAGDQLTGGFVPTTSNGGVVSAGVGARLLFFTVLARGRIGFFGLGQLYSAGLEAGLHVPLGRLEPHVELGGGYATLTRIEGGDDAVASAMRIRGGYGRLGVGLDYFVLPVLSVGLGASAELLGMSRAAFSSAEVAGLSSTTASVLLQRGSGIGGAVSATFVVGLHL